MLSAALFPPAHANAAMPSSLPWDRDEIRIETIDGQPSPGFDCGREAQNAFLYSVAWRDAKAGVSVTHLTFVNGILAGFATLMMDRIALGSNERLRGVRWRLVPSLKIGQLGVDQRFAGAGLGKFLVAHAIQLARRVRVGVGCRLVTLDAQPDLVPWYQDQGFHANEQEQVTRTDLARATGRDALALPVSMRFDLGALHR